MKKLTLDLSMVDDETLRSVEEVLLIELETLREQGEDRRHDLLVVELKKLEDHFDIG